MKKYYIFFYFLFPLIIAAQEIDADKLERKNGLAYESGKEKPFSGEAVTFYKNGKKQTSTEYKGGQINGKIEMWYENGPKQVEGFVLNGDKAGQWIAWYENGNKLRQGSFKNGKEEGKYTWWFENGKIQKKGSYHDGVSDGKWEWYYENGQKKQEGKLKGETSEGTWKDWHENGKQKMTGSFKNGVKDGDWTWWDDKGNITTKKKYAKGLILESTNEFDLYVEKMEYYLNERDFKSALANAEKAVGTIEDKSEKNSVYMELAVYHSKVYSYFQHLDEAEAVILKAAGLPDNDVKEIVKTNYKPPVEELKALANKINSYPEAKTKIGPHIALAFIYNIIGDSINLGQEQQLMMERSDNSDWVVKMSLELYKIRGAKENNHGQLNYLREEIAAKGETKENQLQLAVYLYQTGKLSEAASIADKYLALDPRDIDCLYLKTNIEMALGNFEKMKAFEKQILAVNPKAFDK